MRRHLQSAASWLSIVAARRVDDTKCREIAEAVISGHQTAAQMARMFGVSPPTVSRIVAAHVWPKGRMCRRCRGSLWRHRQPRGWLGCRSQREQDIGSRYNSRFASMTAEWIPGRSSEPRRARISDLVAVYPAGSAAFRRAHVRRCSRIAMPSPSRLKLVPVSTMARPGKIDIHQAVVMKFLPSAISTPHSAVGGCAPRPR